VLPRRSRTWRWAALAVARPEMFAGSGDGGRRAARDKPAVPEPQAQQQEQRLCEVQLAALVRGHQAAQLALLEELAADLALAEQHLLERRPQLGTQPAVERRVPAHLPPVHDLRRQQALHRL